MGEPSLRVEARLDATNPFMQGGRHSARYQAGSRYCAARTRIISPAGKVIRPVAIGEDLPLFLCGLKGASIISTMLR